MEMEAEDEYVQAAIDAEAERGLGSGIRGEAC